MFWRWVGRCTSDEKWKDPYVLYLELAVWVEAVVGRSTHQYTCKLRFSIPCKGCLASHK